METLDFTRVNRDTNGNPRYVVHFLDLLNSAESYDYTITVDEKYEKARKRANSIGGRVYTAKSYGGGFVFQSYNVGATFDAIQIANGGKFEDYKITRG